MGHENEDLEVLEAQRPMRALFHFTNMAFKYNFKFAATGAINGKNWAILSLDTAFFPGTPRVAASTPFKLLAVCCSEILYLP
ncbi:hypothetical protein CDAR_69651 [Caerostris darwini]|uniref:Uncharacterized protein n=1 Tax=Caerostris darwini TaxID=1538125 RepID=A0AAV4U0V9_9ARAC|nr:hypothetical protein CDAR_69651 [Caerostris darwini]